MVVFHAILPVRRAREVHHRESGETMAKELISERAQLLLKALIERYIRDGQPVGSKALVEASGLPVSAATARNVMADLEELGLIRSPHTSAGRVPTVQGYRLFVDSLITVRPLGHDAIATMQQSPLRTRDGKTYFVMNDVRAFRAGVARLLAEVQRIKAEGDYDAAKHLFDTYGVHFDPALRDEVVARVDALKLPSYTAFVMPRLEALYGADGSVVDVNISYPLNLEAQMLEYSRLTRCD